MYVYVCIIYAKYMPLGFIVKINAPCFKSIKNDGKFYFMYFDVHNVHRSCDNS